MFERFTDQARHVVALAQEEARMLDHNYIGTEHMLLALIREDTGTAAMALRSLGIAEDTARRQVEESIGRGQHGTPRGHIPITPPAKGALELSMREAIALGSSSIGTEHILLSLIRQGEGEGEGTNPATRVLKGLGVDPNRVRQQVVVLVSASPGEDEAGMPPVAAGGERRETGKKRELLSEVRDRLNSIEWRLAVLEQRVGTGSERAALPSLTDEVERLRDVLRRHGIDPEDGPA
jgi:ATP-dependent Clp protease ATP-binding subunit ClpC